MRVGGGWEGIQHGPSALLLEMLPTGARRLEGWPPHPPLGIRTDLGATQRDLRNQERVSGLGIGGQGEGGGLGQQCFLEVAPGLSTGSASC